MFHVYWLQKFVESLNPYNSGLSRRALKNPWVSKRATFIDGYFFESAMAKSYKPALYLCNMPLIRFAVVQTGGRERESAYPAMYSLKIETITSFVV